MLRIRPERKRCFFEKKQQKTFFGSGSEILGRLRAGEGSGSGWPVRASLTRPAGLMHRLAEVFCFFFSKKKRLLWFACDDGF
jgi:hypothetical protein